MHHNIKLTYIFVMYASSDQWTTILTFAVSTTFTVYHQTEPGSVWRALRHKTQSYRESMSPLL